MGEVVQATKEGFQDLVVQGTVLVDVWGPQCRPCLALMPHVDRIASAYPDLTVVKLEAPKARRLCIEMKVMGLPTFLLFKDGQEVSRISEPKLSPEQLSTWLEQTLNTTEASKGGEELV